MTTYSYDKHDLEALQGKTILVTGCSTGIGQATARLAYKYGANVILADWDEHGLTVLVEELEAGAEQSGSRVIFNKTNVAEWNDMANVFALGWERFGAIDAVISNAGVNWGENLLKHEIDPVTHKLQAPEMTGLNINLLGHIYAVNLATYYFAKHPHGSYQIVLTASAAAFLDSPPLHLYSAAKAGLVGMMRSLRHDLPKQGVSINVVAPWMTMTPMASDLLRQTWGSLPCNNPEGVGHALLFPVLRPKLNGKCFFVAGNKMTEFEDTISRSQPEWMGHELNASIEKGQAVILGQRPFG